MSYGWVSCHVHEPLLFLCATIPPPAPSLSPGLPVWGPSTPMVLSHQFQEHSPSGQYLGDLPSSCCSPGEKGANHVIS